jgi:hypothetical protein
MMIGLVPQVNRAFSVGGFFCSIKPGALPQARGELRLWRQTSTRTVALHM